MAILSVPPKPKKATPKQVYFNPPLPRLGDKVLFYPNSDKERDRPWHGRVVTVAAPVMDPEANRQDNPRTIEINVEIRGNLVFKQSVRHIDDERSRDEHLKRWGAWDFHPETLMLRELETLMPELRSLAAPMEGRTTSK